MEWIQVIVLAVVQGVSEFLPVSSSGHLLMLPHVFGWPYQGIEFDIALHLGSLIAVCSYFRADLKQLYAGCIDVVHSRYQSNNAHLCLTLVIATLPILVVGALFRTELLDSARTPLMVGISMVCFGLLLGIADQYHRGNKYVTELTFGSALLIGVAQVFALVPGAGQSAVTITAGLLLGLHRQSAARFAFLLLIPAIVFACIAEVIEHAGQVMQIDYRQAIVAVTITAVTAYLSIHALMVFIHRVGLMPFVIYRLAAGAAVLVWLV